MMNITPRSSPKAEPKRRAKRRQDGEEKKTHKSSQKRQRRHGGSDSNIYGNDFGILPSDDSKVLASAVPDRVPLGFICGYPVGIGGELYGGSMFLPSAATDTLQGQAINKVNEVWGEDKHRGWDNDKSLGMPVCKKKFRPFNFTLKRKNPMGGIDIKVVRMYGCACHSNLRKEMIAQHGERNGWEPFGQWSLGKAKAAARREVMKLNAQLGNSSELADNDASSSSGYSSSSSSEEEEQPPSICTLTDDTKKQQPCNLKGKFDDMEEESTEK